MNTFKKIMLEILKLILAAILILALAQLIISLRPAKKNLRVPFSSDDNFSGIYDTADLFDSSQEKSLRKTIERCSEDLEMNIIVYINDVYRSDENVGDFTANYYDQLAGKEYTDGVFMYIDLSSNAYDYLSCSGKAGIIYGGRIDEFFDEYALKRPSSAYAPDPDWFDDTVEHFCDTLRSFSKSYEQRNSAYEKDDANNVYFFDYGGEFYVTKHLPPGIRQKRISLSLLGGYILSVIISWLIKKHYQFDSAANPGIYVRKDRTNFRERSDTFIRSYVSKHKIETSSGGSRGGGGRSHSGGHVGGGRHF